VMKWVRVEERLGTLNRSDDLMLPSLLCSVGRRVESSAKHFERNSQEELKEQWRGESST
jgi:hypothetical protein